MRSKYRNALDSVVTTLLLNPKAKQATKYLAKDEVVKATRQHPASRSERQITFLLTIGKPNFLGRRFVKQCIKAGEPFPVKKVQIKLAA